MNKKEWGQLSAALELIDYALRDEKARKSDDLSEFYKAMEILRQLQKNYDIEVEQ